MVQARQHKLVHIYLEVQEVKNENIIMCDSKGVIYKEEKILINLNRMRSIQN